MRELECKAPEASSETTTEQKVTVAIDRLTGDDQANPYRNFVGTVTVTSARGSLDETPLVHLPFPVPPGGYTFEEWSTLKKAVDGAIDMWRQAFEVKPTPGVIMWRGRAMRVGKCPPNDRCLACERLGEHLEPA